VHPGTTPPRVSGGDAIVGLEAHLDRSSVLRGSDGLVRVELALRGGAGANAPRVPTDLVVVLDRSGSMEGQPIATALAAVRELIAGLADGDRFALVSYASDVTLDIALEAASPQARERWSQLVASIVASGGTHLASGLDLGHAVLAETERSGRSPRLIVLSDGLANQGDYSLEGLRARAGRARTGEYVLSAVGIGDGFDETVMSALADAGTGNFYYLPDVARLSGVFADEFAAARETVARAVAVRIAPAAGVRVAGAGGYPLEPEGGAVRFHPGDLFAGQERRVWLTLHAPTESVGDVSLGEVQVEYATPEGERGRAALAALPQLTCVASDADYYASFDADRYQRANLRDSVGELKKSVARKIAAGRQAEAVAELDAYRARSETEQLRALGYVGGDEARAVEELRDAVSAPAAAAPAARNQLGKQLFESGRDDQRAGAKR
jgi:Ca-activated chloride channel family protein